jgi:hypothetical protein
VIKFVFLKPIKTGDVSVFFTAKSLNLLLGMRCVVNIRKLGSVRKRVAIPNYGQPWILLMVRRQVNELKGGCLLGLWNVVWGPLYNTSHRKCDRTNEHYANYELKQKIVPSLTFFCLACLFHSNHYTMTTRSPSLSLKINSNTNGNTKLHDFTHALRPETADKRVHVHLNELISPLSGWKELLRQRKKSASTFDTETYFPVLKTKAVRSSKTSVYTKLHGVVFQKRTSDLTYYKICFQKGPLSI